MLVKKRTKRSRRRGNSRPSAGYRRKMGVPNVGGSVRESVRTSTGAPEYAPDRALVRQKYVDYREAVSLASTLNYVFSGNSGFDPDVTNVGRQPTGFDEMAAIYSRYRVLSSSISCKFVSLKPLDHAVQICLLPTRTSAALADFGTYAALPYATTLLLGDESGMNRGSLSHEMSTSKFNGITDVFGDLSYAAFTSGNPAERWYWQYFCEASDHLSVLLIAVTVRLEYTIEFFARADTSVSLFNILSYKLARKYFNEAKASTLKGKRCVPDSLSEFIVDATKEAADVMLQLGL